MKPSLALFGSAFASACALLLLSGAAHAQTHEPEVTPPVIAPPDTPTAPPAPTPLPSEGATQWKHDYGMARERLLAGDFADAAERFDLLARDLHATASERALAAALADVARSWSQRGLALVKRQDLPDPNVSARAVNERTTDEIAQLYTGAVVYGVGTGLWLDAHTAPTNSAGAVLPMLLFSAAAAGLGVTALGTAAGLGIAWLATGGMPKDRPEDRETGLLLEPSLVPVKGGATVGVMGAL